MTVQATVNATLKAINFKAGTTGDLQQSKVFSWAEAYEPGTATKSQANLLFTDVRTLTSGSAENLDLSGSLVDAFGATMNYAEVVLIGIRAVSTNTTNLTVGAASPNGFYGPLNSTGTLTLRPGEFAVFSSQDGWTVTAGSADLFRVVNAAGASAKYEVMIIGRTAAA